MLLSRLSALSGGVGVAVAGRPLVAALPALARHARCYGFGSHMSDNQPEVGGSEALETARMARAGA